MKFVFLPMETDLDKDNKKIMIVNLCLSISINFNQRNNISCDIYLNENGKLD